MSAAVIPDGFTREELLSCIDRELRFRERVFARRVQSKTMTLEQSMREQALMRAVRAVIAQLPATQGDLPLGRGMP